MRKHENLSDNSQASQTEDLLLCIEPRHSVTLILLLSRAQYFDNFLSPMHCVGYHMRRSRNFTEFRVHYKLSFTKT